VVGLQTDNQRVAINQASIPKKTLDGRAPIFMIADASGTNRPSKAGSANRAGSGHGGSGESPDVRGRKAPNRNAPESDDRPDAQVGLLLSALLRDSTPKNHAP
jgi:hypothetical protein